MIYKITNCLNGDFYIGYTSKTIEERFHKHKLNCQKGKQHLYNAMRKYGIENFKVESILDSGTFEDEIRLIEELNPHYNETGGGLGGDTSKSENFKKSMIEYHSKKPKEEYATNGFKGKSHTSNTKQLQAEKRKQFWDNPKNKEIASKRLSGKNNPMYNKTPGNAIQVEYDGVVYNSQAAVTRETGLSMKYILKNGGKKL